jgi:hypothetical protein
LTRFNAKGASPGHVTRPFRNRTEISIQRAIDAEMLSEFGLIVKDSAVE